MPKTKANKRSRKSIKLGKTMKKMDKCYNPATIHGFHRWYIAMFEKLGWMVLAKSKGHMNDKIVSYKLSLTRLEEKIRCKINTTYDMDKQIDLKLMLQDVRILIDHVDKDF